MKKKKSKVRMPKCCGSVKKLPVVCKGNVSASEANGRLNNIVKQ